MSLRQLIRVEAQLAAKGFRKALPEVSEIPWSLAADRRCRLRQLESADRETGTGEELATDASCGVAQQVDHARGDVRCISPKLCELGV